MTKYETITYVELKKIMKLSITLGVELGIYISYTQFYIELDRQGNECAEHKRIYTFNVEDLHDIFILTKSYSKLHKRKLSMW